MAPLFFFLLFSFCSIVKSIAIENPTLSCQDSCIRNYDNANEDACLRGCSFSSVDPSKCKESCDDTYNKTELNKACIDGCYPDGLLRIRIKLLSSNPDGGFPDLMSYIKALLSPPDTLNSKDLDHLRDQSHNDDKSDSEQLKVTRIRIFRIFTGGQDSPLDMLSLLRNLFSFNNLTTNPEFIDNHEMHAHHTVGRKFTMFLRHVYYRPLFLPCVALSILLLLLLLKLVCYLCRRKKREVQYTLLPTYNETMNVKVPHCDGGAEELPPKAPIHA